MTKDEAKAKLATTSSVEEMADLMLECFRIFGHEGTEKILIEISQGEAGKLFYTVKQDINDLKKAYATERPERKLIFIEDEFCKLIPFKKD